MKPITFQCVETIPLQPEEIAEQILDLVNWPEFTGYGPMPGIEKAEFEIRTEEIVGTRIRVTNTDGSSHIEEIHEWEPARRLVLSLSEFTPPLSKLTRRFEEVFEFEPEGTATLVTRSFAMYPTSGFARPMLWMISLLLKRAIARHLHQMREAAGG